MDTKLTPKIDKYIVDEAKDYARSKHIGVSFIVENDLNTITQIPQNQDKILFLPLSIV